MRKLSVLLLIFFIVFKVWFISNITPYKRYSQTNLDKEIDMVKTGRLPTYPFVMPLMVALLDSIDRTILSYVIPVMLNLITIYFLAKLFKDYRIAILTMLIPNIFLNTSYLLTDTLFVMLGAGAIYFYKEKQFFKWFLTYSLCLLSKPLLPLFIILIFYSIRKDKKYLKLLGIMIVVALVFYAYIQRDYGNWFNINNYMPSNQYFWNVDQLGVTFVTSGLFLLIPLLFRIKKPILEIKWLISFMPFIIIGASSMSRYFLISNLILLPLITKLSPKEHNQIHLLTLIFSIITIVLTSNIV